MQNVFGTVPYVSYTFSLPSGTLQEIVGQYEDSTEDFSDVVKTHVRYKIIPDELLRAPRYSRETLLKKFRSFGEEYLGGFIIDATCEERAERLLVGVKREYEGWKRQIEFGYLFMLKNEGIRRRALGEDCVPREKMPPLEKIIPWFKFDYNIARIRVTEDVQEVLMRNNALSALQILNQYISEGKRFSHETLLRSKWILSSLLRWEAYLPKALKARLSNFCVFAEALGWDLDDAVNTKKFEKVLVEIANFHSSFCRTETASILGYGVEIPTDYRFPLEVTESLFFPGLGLSDSQDSFPLVPVSEPLD